MHILRECEATRGEIEIRELMDEKGGGYEIMKRINGRREEKGVKREEKERGERKMKLTVR